MSNLTYCIKCKQRTPVVNPEVVTTRNNKSQLKSSCPVCGITKTQFISDKQAKKGGFLGGLGKLFGFGKKTN